jgi:Lrp/AsnC family transcriptional regulator
MTDLAVQLPEANRRLDAIDRKILTVLQEDASLSVAEIGTGSGCRRRRAGSGSSGWRPTA